MKGFCLRCRRYLASLPGCPRRWFFPSILWLYFLFTILFPMLVAVAYRMENSAARAFCLLVQTLSIIPLPLLSAPGGKLAQQASEAPEPLSFSFLPDTLYVSLLGVSAIILVVMMLLLCWLRLRDAGLSSWFLLLGLLPSLALEMLGLAQLFSFFAVLSLILYWLSLPACSLVLLLLYCKAGQKVQAQPPVPDNSPQRLPGGDAEGPPMHLDRLCISLFLALLFGFCCLRRADGATWAGIPLEMLFTGGLYALLLLFHRSSERTRETTMRHRALGFLYIVFVPPHIAACLLTPEMRESAPLLAGYCCFYVANVLWLALALPYLLRRILRQPATSVAERYEE